MAAKDPNARTRDALAAAPTPGAGSVAKTVAQLLSTANVRRRFEDVLGARAGGFMSSVIHLTNSVNHMKDCDPRTVLAAAAVAAALDLPIDPNLGHAYIIPYQLRDRGWVAQFQMGYLGFVQLALRSGSYKTMHTGIVYEGEIEAQGPRERLMGEIRFSGERTSDKVVGYASYFRLLNGFEKWDYLSVEDALAHAARYSKSFSRKDSPWQTQRDAMSCKTSLKRLVRHYGPLSVQMQTAVLADQAVLRGEPGEAPEPDYVDGAEWSEGAAAADEGGEQEDAETPPAEGGSPAPTLNDMLGGGPAGDQP